MGFRLTPGRQLRRTHSFEHAMALQRVTVVAGIDVLASSGRDRVFARRHVGNWTLFQGAHAIGRGSTARSFGTEEEAVEAAERLADDELRAILLGPRKTG